jgi:gliding motility-associated lipoprotein GldH
MKKASLILLVLLINISCDKQRVFEEFRSFKDHTWNSHDILQFNVSMTDTASAHNIYLSVRNTGEYEYSNLYLFITTHSPNGTMVRDTVEIILADERGKWLGKGAASVFTLYQPFRQNIRFPLRGIYQFEVEQAMWIKDLKHISDIGLRIEKARN